MTGPSQRRRTLVVDDDRRIAGLVWRCVGLIEGRERRMVGLWVWRKGSYSCLGGQRREWLAQVVECRLEFEKGCERAHWRCKQTGIVDSLWGGQGQERQRFGCSHCQVPSEARSEHWMRDVEPPLTLWCHLVRRCPVLMLCVVEPRWIADDGELEVALEVGEVLVLVEEFAERMIST